jgi:hypothetical protein
MLGRTSVRAPMQHQTSYNATQMMRDRQTERRRERSSTKILESENFCTQNFWRAGEQDEKESRERAANNLDRVRGWPCERSKLLQ